MEKTENLKQQDIESLGFKLLKDSSMEQEYQTEIFEDNDKEYWWELTIDDKENMTKLSISKWSEKENNSCESLLFNGSVQNKSELERLMRQLCILL